MTANPNQPAGAPVIEMQGVAASTMYDVTFAALENVNWTVMAGEFWVLAGQQKSGKTDFLMTTVGLMPPLAGSYHLFGRDMGTYSEAHLADRLRVGFVFANGQLFNHLTVSENLALPLRYHRNLNELEAERETRWLLELLELTPVAAVTPSNLSRDWMKRTALARALVLKPEVLLCDDPLAGLGSRHRQWWVRFLDQLREGHAHFGGRPMTLVVTTEDLSPWKSEARRFALLQDRKFSTVNSWADLEKTPDRAVRELMAGPLAATI